MQVNTAFAKRLRIGEEKDDGTAFEYGIGPARFDEMSEPSSPSTAPASNLKKKALGWAAVAAGPALCIWLFNYYIHRPVVHRLYRSPDGRFELTVYRKPSFHFLPSRLQEVDDPGFVCLVRKANQRELNRAPLPKVGVVNVVLWEKEYVEIPQVDAWLLPR